MSEKSDSQLPDIDDELKRMLDAYYNTTTIKEKRKSIRAECTKIDSKVASINFKGDPNLIDPSVNNKYELLKKIASDDPDYSSYDKVMDLHHRATTSVVQKRCKSGKCTCRNQMFEVLWDIMIKLEMPDMFINKSVIGHYGGRISQGPEPIKDINKYFKGQIIKTSKGGGISDITFSIGSVNDRVNACEGFPKNTYEINDIWDFNNIIAIDADGKIIKVDRNQLINIGDIIEKIKLTYRENSITETINYDKREKKGKKKGIIDQLSKLSQFFIDRKQLEVESIKCTIKKRNAFYFCSVKYFSKSKSIDKYDISKLYNAYKTNPKFKTTENNIVIITNQSDGFTMKKLRASSTYISSQVKNENIWGMDDLKICFKKLKLKLKSLDNDVDKLFKATEKNILIPRFHQELFVQNTKAIIEDGTPLSNNFIWGAVARSGKTYMAARFLQVCKDKYKNILIITPFPTETLNQWKEVFANFTGFDDYKIICPKCKSKSLKLGPKNIFIFSKQTLEKLSGKKLKDLGDDFSSKCEYKKTTIESIKCYLLGEFTDNDGHSCTPPGADLVFYDEAHQGGTTETSENILKQYLSNKCIKIFLTATYLKLISEHLSTTMITPTKNQCVWSYEDIMIGKRSFSELKEILVKSRFSKKIVQQTLDTLQDNFDISEDYIQDSYSSFPEIHTLTSQLDSKELGYITAQIDGGQKGAEFNMVKLLEMDKKNKGEFKYKTNVVGLLNYIQPLRPWREESDTKESKILDGVTDDQRKKSWNSNLRGRTIYERIKAISERTGNTTNPLCDRSAFNPNTQLWFLPIGRGKKEDDNNASLGIQICMAKLICKHRELGRNYDVMLISSKKKHTLRDTFTREEEKRIIVKCLGNANNDIKECIRVQEVESYKKGRGLIILANKKLTTGVTLKCVDIIILLDEIKSHDLNFQKIFRALTERKDKKIGFVVDLNPQRIIQLFYKYGSEVIKHKRSNTKKIEHLIDLFHIDEDFYTLTEETPEDTWLNKQQKLLKDFNKYIDFSVIEKSYSKDFTEIFSDDYFKNPAGEAILGAMSEDHNETTQVVKVGVKSQNQSVPKADPEQSDGRDDGHSADGAAASTNDDEEKAGSESVLSIAQMIAIKQRNTIQNFKKIAQELLGIIAILSECSLEPEPSSISEEGDDVDFNEEIKKILDPEDADNPDKVLYTAVETIAIRHVLHREVIKKIIAFINEPSVIEKISPYYRSMITEIGDIKKDHEWEKLLNYINHKLQPTKKGRESRGEIFTPLKLITTMLDKLDKYYKKTNNTTKSIFTNKTLTWLDPANGIGNFPLVVYMKLMTGLENEFPVKTERHNHIIRKMLYMVEFKKTNVNISRKIFGEDANIIKRSFLKLDSPSWPTNKKGVKWPKKFSIVMGNPPYNIDGVGKHGKKNMDTKFTTEVLNKYLKSDGFLLFITKTTWKGLKCKGHADIKNKKILYINTLGFWKGWDANAYVNYFIIHNTLPVYPYSADLEFNKKCESALIFKDMNIYSSKLKFIKLLLKLKKKYGNLENVSRGFNRDGGYSNYLRVSHSKAPGSDKPKVCHISELIKDNNDKYYLIPEPNKLMILFFKELFPEMRRLGLFNGFSTSKSLFLDIPDFNDIRAAVDIKKIAGEILAAKYKIETDLPTSSAHPSALSTTPTTKPESSIETRLKQVEQLGDTLAETSVIHHTADGIRATPDLVSPKPKKIKTPTKITTKPKKSKTSPKQTGGKRNIYTKIYDPISKIYVSIFSKKGGNLIKKYSRQSNKKTNQKGGRNYNKIYNPVSKKFVKLNSSLGLKILQKYLN